MYTKDKKKKQYNATLIRERVDWMRETAILLREANFDISNRALDIKKQEIRVISKKSVNNIGVKRVVPSYFFGKTQI